MEAYKQTFTITFGDQAENHVGMQKIGKAATEGFTFDDLTKVWDYFREKGIECDLISLKEYLPSEYDENVDEAYILIARKGLDCLIAPHTSEEFYLEQDALEKDKQAFMYGRVVNKKARHNLCFGFENQEPDYEKGKGRIVSFETVPLLNMVRNNLPLVIGEKGNDLVAEGNYYYDVKKCHIGYHGDAERHKVIAVRLGATFPLFYQWYYKSEAVGKVCELSLNHGDIYFMSEKAVGTDWKKKNTPTLRHAAALKNPK